MNLKNVMLSLAILLVFTGGSIASEEICIEGSCYDFCDREGCVEYCFTNQGIYDSYGEELFDPIAKLSYTCDTLTVKGSYPGWFGIRMKATFDGEIGSAKGAVFFGIVPIYIIDWDLYLVCEDCAPTSDEISELSEFKLLENF